MYEFVNYSDHINKICEPLFKCLPICHFSYIEIHNSGNFHALSSSRDLYEQYLQRQYYQRTPIHALVGFGKPGIYLSDIYNFPELPPLDEHNAFLAEHDYGHTCMILKRETIDNTLINKLYSYEGRLHDTQINHVYLNNIDLMKRFTQYFDQQLLKIKSSLPMGSVPVQFEMGFHDLLKTEDESTIISSKNKLLSTLSHANEEEPRPTPREMEIIQWNLKGKTAEETASIMGISRRTVEKHFEKLRKKFGCYSKSQVALKMAKLLDY